MILARSLAALALGMVLVFAIVGAIDPGHHPLIRPGADEVEHAAVAFLLTTLCAAVFPRLPPLLAGATLLVLGAGLEALQYLGLVSGQLEPGDMIADVAGVAAAWLGLYAAAARAAAVRRPARPAGEPGAQRPDGQG